MRCPGSYGDGKPDTTRHPSNPKGRVTGECPACGKRVSYVTAHALPLKPRVLGLHEAKPTDAKP
jgi:hypothetical protein